MVIIGVKYIHNSRSFFVPSEYEKIGQKLCNCRRVIIVGSFSSIFLFSSNKFSRILLKHFFKMCQNDFECVKTYTRIFSLNNIIKVKIYLEDEYEFLPEFFLIGQRRTWNNLGNK